MEGSPPNGTKKNGRKEEQGILKKNIIKLEK